MLKLNRAERKMLTYVSSWNFSGTPEQIANARPYEVSTKYLESLARAVRTLAKLGLIKDCQNYFHSLDTTCQKCNSPLRDRNSK
jgi:hypothetical protein